MGKPQIYASNNTGVMNHKHGVFSPSGREKIYEYVKMPEPSVSVHTGREGERRRSGAKLKP
jgi:hypothetical protein